MRLFIFWFFATILLAVFYFFDDQKEGRLAIVASVPLALIAFLIIVDRWRNPEVYKKKEKWTQKALFDKRKPKGRWKKLLDTICSS